MLLPKKYLIVDIETTGLQGKPLPQKPLADEILEVSIIDQNGIVLLNTLVRPQYHNQWDNAHIHGIKPEDVFSPEVPIWADLLPQIQVIVAGRTLVAYGADFEQSFLGAALATSTVLCALEAFSRFMGNWLPEANRYKRVSLLDAAQYVGYHWEEKPHSAVGDCLATLAVCEYLQVRGIYFNPQTNDQS